MKVTQGIFLKALFPFFVSLGSHIFIIWLLSTLAPFDTGTMPRFTSFKVSIIQEKDYKANSPSSSLAHKNHSETNHSRLVPKTSSEKEQVIGAIGHKNDEAITLYLHHFRQKIFNHLTYPPQARQKKQEGRVELKLKILENGKITQLQIERSSGFSTLDAAAIAAVESCQQLSPPPLALNSKILRVPIDFNLKN